MNKADSTALRTLLIARGLLPADAPESADVVILNTCAVRERAAIRVYGRLGYFKMIKQTVSPNLLLVVTGCLPRVSREEIKRTSLVDIVSDTYSQEDLVELIVTGAPPETATRGAKNKIELFKETGYVFKPAEREPAYPFKAFVSITHGCDNWCAYCIVPKTRGAMISRKREAILSDIQRLIGEGVKEITLLGQNVNSYGEDRGEPFAFVRLLEAIDPLMKGNWLRFTTSHPKDFSKELADALLGLSSPCKQLHLPLQSGNNRILAAMRRQYDRNTYFERIKYLRAHDPLFPISTDILVGFANETEEEFNDTLSALEEARFEEAYMYRYSERKGSLAYEQKIPYDEKTALERLSRLIERQRALAEERLGQFLNVPMEVLLEERAKDGVHLVGRSKENRMVIAPDTSGAIGDIVTLTPTSLRGITFIAEEPEGGAPCGE